MYRYLFCVTDLWDVDENDEEPDVGEDGEQGRHAEHGEVLDPEHTIVYAGFRGQGLHPKTRR